jgi:hypothetical protein
VTGNKNLFAAAAALIVVVSGLAIGFKMLGPPKDQRAITADEHRVSDLRALSITLYGYKTSGLPTDLSLLASGDDIRDPLTNQPYAYIRGSGTSYQLCATFAFASDTFASSPENLNGQMPGFWKHPKGRYCYQLDAARFY